MRIAVLISGNGSNLQALLHASFAGRITGRVVAVFSNRAEAYGLERAHRAGVPAEAILLKSFENRAAYEEALKGMRQPSRDVQFRLATALLNTEDGAPRTYGTGSPTVLES